jgi:hypothetical protein
MDFTLGRTGAALLAVGLALAAGCGPNQNQDANSNDDFKDLVLLQVNPPDGVTNVFRDTDVVLEFTAPVDPASVNSTTVQIRDSGGGTPLGSFIVEYERVIFRPLNPPALQAGTTYTVTLPTYPSVPTLMSVEQTPLMGQAPTVRNPSRFTTGAQISPDNTCPVAVAVNPPQSVVDPFIAVPYGATGVPTNAVISVRFSESIDPLSLGPGGPFITAGSTGNATSYAFRLVEDPATTAALVSGTLSLRDGGRVLEFDPNTLISSGTGASNANANGYLSPNTTYRIDLLSDMQTPLGIRDFAGNYLASTSTCTVPSSFTFVNPPATSPWVGTFSWTFTTATVASTPVSDNVVEAFTTDTLEAMLPPMHDAVVVAPGPPPVLVNPAQSSGGSGLFAFNTQAEWNTASPAAMAATITNRTSGTPTADPGIVVFEPGIATSSRLSNHIDLNGVSPPFDNNLTGSQVGWRLQFLLLASEMKASPGVMHPQARAVTSGVITRLFLRQDSGSTNVGPHTYNNLVVRFSHTDQGQLGALTDPIVTPTALPTFRYQHTQGAVPVLPTTVARISAYSTPPVNANGYFEIPIAPNFVWNGTQNVVVDIECRGGTGIIDLMGDTAPATPTAGALRMTFGQVQTATSNPLGLLTNNNALTPNLAVNALPSCVMVLDTWRSSGSPPRRGTPTAPENGFTKPQTWPGTVERGTYDKSTGTVNPFPTNAGINPDMDGTITPAFLDASGNPNPPEDLVVRTGLNLSTTTSPEFGMFLYRTFTVEAGAIVNVTGPNPCIIRATHGIRISGTINADGFSGSPGTSLGGTGGAGGPGAGGGGNGGNGAATGTGTRGQAGIGWDLYNPGATNITDPANGAVPPGWGSGGGGLGGAAGASGGGGGYASAGTPGPVVGASPGGDGGVAWGSASIIFLHGGAGGGGGGGGVSTSGAGGGGGGGGGGYLQLTSDRNVLIDGTAVLTARGGNGGSVQGSTPGGAGGGGAGGAIVLEGATVRFQQLGGQPGAVIDAAQDLVGPLTFGGGGQSPAAGAGGNGGNGRIRVVSTLSGGAAPGQSTATFRPATPAVFDSSSTGWLLIPRFRTGTPPASSPMFTTTQCEARSIWIDTGNADPNYQSAIVNYNYNGIVTASNLTVTIEACDTDIQGTPDSATILTVLVPLSTATTTVTQGLSGLIPSAPATSGRLVRFRSTVTATGSPVVSPVLTRVEIQYQY